MRREANTRKAEAVASGFKFLECPRWHEGRLYVSDFFDLVVRSFRPDGSFDVVCEVEGQPAGLGFLPDGELIVVSMADQRILRLGQHGLETHADLSSHCAFLLNDMLADETGRLYVGNFGYSPGAEPIKATDLYMVRETGQAEVAATDLMFPNGMARTPDGRTLLVAETYASRISAFDIGGEGTLSGRREWASFPHEPAESAEEAVAAGAILPDGICLDAEGALWVANANRPGVLRVAEGGEILETVDTGELAGYAVALGGDDGGTLLICAAPPLGSYDARVHRRSSLLGVSVGVPGAGL
jgi:sugar lactone lactonase YvrE